MSAVNTEFVGREFTRTPPYGVSRAKIAEFAAAVAAESPLHTDPGAARAAGYADVLAPPTFAVLIAQRAEAEYIEDPAAGIDFSRVVHASESFTHHRPIVAGDLLQTSVHVDDVKVRSALTMITTRTEIAATSGEAVCTVTSTLAVRGEEA